MPKFVKGSQEAKDHMANLRAMAKAKREALKNVSITADDNTEESNDNEKEHWTTSAFLKDESSDSEVEVEVEVVEKNEVDDNDKPVTRATRATRAKKTRAPRKKKIIIEEAHNEVNVEVENDPGVRPEPKKYVRKSKQSEVASNAMPPVNFDTNPLLAPKVIRFH